MSQQGVPEHVARAMKKKIVTTTIFLVLLALGIGGGIFGWKMPKDALAEEAPAESFEDVPSRIRLKEYTPLILAMNVGERLDFSTAVSMRSKEAQIDLGADYRRIYGRAAYMNVKVNKEFDVPVARMPRPEIIIETEVVVAGSKTDPDEVKPDSEPEGNGGRGSGDFATSGEGAERMRSIRGQIPEEFKELFEEMIPKVEEAETLWYKFAQGDRSRESYSWLKTAKELLLFVRDGIEQIFEIHEIVRGLDLVSADVSRLLYNINKTYIG